MIKEDYVSYETAKLLKEKGFDEKCPCSYRKKLIDNKIVDEEELFVSANLMLTNSELKDKSYRDIVYCSAPTLQMTMKWLREVYNIFIDISSRFSKNADKDVCFSYRCKKLIDTYKSSYEIGDGEWLNYEEACEEVIKYCLNNLI